GAIKGVGYQTVQTIMNERREQGPYKDFFDFCNRIPSRLRSRRTLEALILTGAMDCFGKNRATLLQSIDKVSDTDVSIDTDLLASVATIKQEYAETEEMPSQQLSDFEKQYLGFYVTAHPVEKAFKQKQYLGIFQLQAHVTHQPILVTLDAVRVIRTKQGQQMAFVELNDGITTMDGVIFPKTYQQLTGTLETSKFYIIWGKFEKRNDKLQLIINRLTTLEAFEIEKRQQTRKIVIREGMTDTLEQQYLTQKQSNNNIAVYQYQESNNQFLFKGYLLQPNLYLDALLDSIKPEHIRLL
ncbi:DNA polymerase III subunit alpha, partial [Staphylococcus pseudintermedius]